MVGKNSFGDPPKKVLVIGKFAAWSVSLILFSYIPVLTMGFLSLRSPSDPIGDPYFSILEILILLIVPALILCMSALHITANKGDKIYTLSALLLAVILGGITSCIHFTILTVSRLIASDGFVWSSQFFSFNWPSVVYTLDILAWDWFFPIAMLLIAPVFRGGKLEKTTSLFLVASGVLSLIGLIGVPLAIMNVERWMYVRNIGIVGYTVTAMIAFSLIGNIFQRRIYKD